VGDLDLGAFDVFQGKVRLVIKLVRPAATLGAPVGQYTDQAHAFFFQARQDGIIEQVGGGDRRLGRLEHGSSPTLFKDVLKNTTYGVTP
jgi:hypothetical protein